MRHFDPRFLLAVPVAVLGCGGGDGGTTAPTLPSAAATVEMRNIAFSPANISIDKGESVRWINRDSADHQLGQLEGPVSGVIESGVIGFRTQGSVSIRFNEAGVYRYRCQLHPTVMFGTVAVSAPPPRDTTGGGTYSRGP